MRGVYVWRVQPGREAEFERRWRAGSRLWQGHAGAQGTRLHRSLSEPSLYLGFATWRSPADREAAQPLVRARELAEPDEYDTEPLSELVYAGFFEEPCDEVLPENGR